MKHVRLVAAIAVTFAFASLGIAWGAAGDPFILGQVNDGGGQTTVLDGGSLKLGHPLVYDDWDATGTVSVGSSGFNTFIWNGNASSDDKVFIFLEPLRRPRFSTSGRWLRNQESILVRVHPAPPPGQTVELAYHIVVFDQP